MIHHLNVAAEFPSDQETFFKSSVVQFWWSCVNSSLMCSPAAVARLLHFTADSRMFCISLSSLSHCCLPISLKQSDYSPLTSDITETFSPRELLLRGYFILFIQFSVNSQLEIQHGILTIPTWINVLICYNVIGSLDISVKEQLKNKVGGECIYVTRCTSDTILKRTKLLETNCFMLDYDWAACKWYICVLAHAVAQNKSLIMRGRKIKTKYTEGKQQLQ